MKSLTENNNLVEPLIFNWHDALFFCRDNLCLKCRLHPAPWGWEGSFVEDRYYVSCPKCREKIHVGNYISVVEHSKAEQNRLIGEREMSDSDEVERMTTEQILKELGY